MLRTHVLGITMLLRECKIRLLNLPISLCCGSTTHTHTHTHTHKHTHTHTHTHTHKNTKQNQTGEKKNHARTEKLLHAWKKLHPRRAFGTQKRTLSSLIFFFHTKLYLTGTLCEAIAAGVLLTSADFLAVAMWYVTTLLLCSAAINCAE